MPFCCSSVGIAVNGWPIAWPPCAKSSTLCMHEHYETASEEWVHRSRCLCVIFPADLSTWRRAIWMIASTGDISVPFTLLCCYEQIRQSGLYLVEIICSKYTQPKQLFTRPTSMMGQWGMQHNYIWSSIHTIETLDFNDRPIKLFQRPLHLNRKQ